MSSLDKSIEAYLKDFFESYRYEAGRAINAIWRGLRRPVRCSMCLVERELYYEPGPGGSGFCPECWERRNRENWNDE